MKFGLWQSRGKRTQNFSCTRFLVEIMRLDRCNGIVKPVQFHGFQCTHLAVHTSFGYRIDHVAQSWEGCTVISLLSDVSRHMYHETIRKGTKRREAKSPERQQKLHRVQHDTEI